MSEVAHIALDFEIIEHPVKEFSYEEWVSVIKGRGINKEVDQRLKQSILHGIPESIRGGLWEFFTNVRSLSRICSFEQLSEKQNELGFPKDVGRTLPKHPLFRNPEGYGQTGLTKILRAYANFDPQVGYCQGMAFIAALLLIYMPSHQSAFWGFVHIMNTLNWREVFLPGTPKLVRMLDSFSRQLESHMLDLYLHFQAQGLHISVFAQYFLTVFAYKTPPELVVRVMDLFLLEGEQVLFNILIKMLQLKRHKLLCMDFEQIHAYILCSLAEECLKEYHITTLYSVNSLHCEEEYTIL